MNSFQWDKGFSVLEVILAAAVFVIFATGAIIVIVQGYEANRLGTEVTVSSQYATEGLEAVRSIKNQSYPNLLTKAGAGNQGIAQAGGVWTFSGTSNALVHNTTDNYIRTITVTAVSRDATGNIVSSGGTVDANTVKVTSTVTWNFKASNIQTTQLSEYMTNWKGKKGGLLVYGDGSTTTDAIHYKTFDALANTWSAAGTLDVDTASSNKALRVARMYSSSTRNEKILISRHYVASTTMYIYASVWNGTAWISPSTQLITWSSATNTDMINFDGVYLANGDFMVVYSDNSTTPKFRTWNGTAWSAQQTLSTTALNAVPNWIQIAARPGFNEVMAAFLTATGPNTATEYYNGAGYLPANWTVPTPVHATAGVLTTKRMIDFEWSTNTPTVGALIYSAAASGTGSKQLNLKLFTANGTGGGNWSSATTGTAQTNALGTMNLEPRPGANEFQVCNKDGAATPTIVCNIITWPGGIPAISAATIVAAATDTGIQRSYDIDWENILGTPLINVYSDNTAIPKFKTFSGGTGGIWSAVNNITTSGTVGVIKIVRIIPQDQGDDMMVLISDANRHIFSIFYNNSTNIMYTTPAGKVWTLHSASTGSAITEFWFDFAWDKF